MAYPDSTSPSSSSSNCSSSNTSMPGSGGSMPGTQSASNFSNSLSPGSLSFSAAAAASPSASASAGSGSGASDSTPSSSAPSCSSSSDTSQSSHPIRYANGEVRMVSGDLSARGYGQPWSHTRSYSNRLNGTLDIKQNRNGAQWFLTDMPQLAQDGGGNLAVISVINDPVWFDKVGSNYVARYFIQETLAADTGNQQFIFTDTQGRIFKFHDFTVTGKEGQFKSFTDAFGHTNSATYDVNNLLTDYRNTSSAPTSAMAYAYYAGGDKDGRLQYATQ